MIFLDNALHAIYEEGLIGRQVNPPKKCTRINRGGDDSLNDIHDDIIKVRLIQARRPIHD